MKTLLAILSILALTGCGQQHVKITTGPTRVSQFATTPLPTPPPAPDPAPVAQNVAGATADVTTAKTSVDQVLDAAKANPAGSAAIFPLETADTHLGAALAKLADATARITELTDRLAKQDAYHTSVEAAHAKDIETLKKSAGDDAAVSAKNIAALQAENAQLRDEQLNRAKSILLWAGIACLLGGAGTIAAEFGLGFLAGFKVAAIAWPVGGVLITLSMNLNKVVWYCEVGTALAVGAVVLWAIYHAYKQPQAVPAKAVTP